MSSRYFKITDHADFPERVIRSDDDGSMHERQADGSWKWNTAGILPDLQGDRLVTEIDKDQAEAHQS
jgi:hypothetical protein